MFLRILIFGLSLVLLPGVESHMTVATGVLHETWFFEDTQSFRASTNDALSTVIVFESAKRPNSFDDCPCYMNVSYRVSNYFRSSRVCPLAKNESHKSLGLPRYISYIGMPAMDLSLSAPCAPRANDSAAPQFSARYASLDLSSCSHVHYKRPAGLLYFQGSRDTPLPCRWTITAPERQHTVTLRLLHLSLYHSPACASSYMRVYDGNSSSKNQIALLCGYNDRSFYPVIIRSRRHVMVVELQTDSLTSMVDLVAFYDTEPKLDTQHADTGYANSTTLKDAIPCNFTLLKEVSGFSVLVDFINFQMSCPLDFPDQTGALSVYDDVTGQRLFVACQNGSAWFPGSPVVARQPRLVYTNASVVMAFSIRYTRVRDHPTSPPPTPGQEAAIIQHQLPDSLWDIVPSSDSDNQEDCALLKGAGQEQPREADTQYNDRSIIRNSERNGENLISDHAPSLAQPPGSVVSKIERTNEYDNEYYELARSPQLRRIVKLANVGISSSQVLKCSLFQFYSSILFGLLLSW